MISINVPFVEIHIRVPLRVKAKTVLSKGINYHTGTKTKLSEIEFDHNDQVHFCFRTLPAIKLAKRTRRSSAISHCPILKNT